jgi:NADH-quinone oxidoreductase subunit L
LAILATLGGLISLPTNSWLNILRLYLQSATEEHHFGTSEYMLMLVAVIGGLVGIGIAMQNTSNKIKFLQKMLLLPYKVKS